MEEDTADTEEQQTIIKDPELLVTPAEEVQFKDKLDSRIVDIASNNF